MFVKYGLSPNTYKLGMLIYLRKNDGFVAITFSRLLKIPGHTL